jgi:hypothetical protein
MLVLHDTFHNQFMQGLHEKYGNTQMWVLHLGSIFSIPPFKLWPI